MSEQKQSYMQQLDEWVEANVIDVLTEDEGAEVGELTEDVVQQVKVAIRQKVLESYRNGQQSGARPARRAQ